MSKSMRFGVLACVAAALCAIGCENNNADDSMNSTTGDMGVVSGEKAACCVQKQCDTTQGECAEKSKACEAKPAQN